MLYLIQDCHMTRLELFLCHYLQLAAPVEVLGRAAAELLIKKKTKIGYYAISLLSCYPPHPLWLLFYFKWSLLHLVTIFDFSLKILGVDVQFELEEAEAFVRQPDGALFSWCERFCCYHHLIYGIVSNFFRVLIISSIGRPTLSIYI